MKVNLKSQVGEHKCPICKNHGSQLGQTPACRGINPRPIFGCGRCEHKWIPITLESTLKALEKYTCRESVIPKTNWVLKHLNNDLLNVPGIRVLDIGCWDGEFLAGCPSSWLRHGVEPNKSASMVARQRGLRVFSETFEMAPLKKNSYDLIVMLDVLEHLPDPLTALQKVSEILAPNGYLFALTGSSNSRGARIFQGCWYYYNYIEHVTFFSPSSMQIAIESLGMNVKTIKKYRHPGSSLFLAGKKISNLLLNAMGNEAPRLAIPVLKQDIILLGISRIMQGRNHMVIVAQGRG